jgi:hypothetical protein
MDDIYLLTRDNITNKLDIVEKGLQEYSLVLNRTKLYTLAIRDIRSSPVGLKVLSTYIGSLEARRTFLTSKITQFKSIVTYLRLFSKQKGLLLLRGSIHLLL